MFLKIVIGLFIICVFILFIMLLSVIRREQFYSAKLKIKTKENSIVIEGLEGELIHKNRIIKKAYRAYRQLQKANSEIERSSRHTAEKIDDYQKKLSLLNQSYSNAQTKLIDALKTNITLHRIIRKQNKNASRNIVTLPSNKRGVNNA